MEVADSVNVWQAFLLLMLAAILAGCAAPFHTTQGTVMGGLTGAGLGAAIGQQNNEAAAGAAIGSLVGAASGAILGNNVDRQIAWENAAIAASFQPVSMHDVAQMTAAGLSDDVIVTHVHRHGFAGLLTATDLVALKQAGVSDRVINALQQPPVVAAAPPPVVPGPAYVVEPVPVPFRRPPWHGPPGRWCR